MDFNASQLLGQYVEKISQYQFTVNNPVFWLMLIVIALVLMRFWDLRKSFSFSIAIGAILLVTTKIEKAILEASSRANEFFDPVIIRILSVIAITLVILYYIFIKTDSAY